MLIELFVGRNVSGVRSRLLDSVELGESSDSYSARKTAECPQSLTSP